MDTREMALIGAFAVLALLGLGALGYRRFQAVREASGRDDRYSPERLLTTEQAHMLDYLHDTFPGQVVLPDIPLRSMLSVRRAAHHQRAARRLDQQKVDFVVCGEDGKPTFAFDIEQHPLSDARHKIHLVKLKNRILKTAGVRFVFLKNGLHRMPSPADFRKQLQLAELPKPPSKEQPVETAENRRQQLESRFSEFDSITTQTAFRDSEVMGLSGLMELDHQSRRSRFSGRPGGAGRVSASGEPSADSRFDSLDVRGGG